MRSVMNRRRFLSGSAAVVGSTLASVGSADEKNEMNCLRWCEQFRQLLLKNAGIHDVYMFPNLASKHIAVAWEQLHSTWDVNEKYSITGPVNRCQLQLYDAMGSLDGHPDFSVQQIIDEGIHRGAEQKDQNDFSTDIASNVRSVLSLRQTDPLNYFPSDRTIQRSTYDKSILTRANTIGTYSILGWHGSSRLRVAQGRTKLIHGEDPVIKNKADAIATSSGSSQSDIDEWVLKRREDYVVGMADAMDQKILHVIYGCAHNWVDNIAQLRKLFTLLVVRPKEVVAWRKSHPDHFLGYDVSGNFLQKGAIPWQLEAGMPRP